MDSILVIVIVVLVGLLIFNALFRGVQRLVSFAVLVALAALALALDWSWVSAAPEVAETGWEEFAQTVDDYLGETFDETSAQADAIDPLNPNGDPETGERPPDGTDDSSGVPDPDSSAPFPDSGDDDPIPAWW